MESIKKVWAKMKEHKKASIIGAAVIVVLLIVIAVNNSSSNGFYTIDVAQNYKLECSGDNGYANPNASIDSTAKDNLIESILFKLYPNSSDDYVKGDIYSKFLSGLDFTYNKKDHISNGDEITATANYDKNEAKELKLKLTDTTLKTKAAYLSSYVHKDTNISETLQKNIDQKATETISQWFTNENDLSQTWHNIGGEGFDNISLVNGPEIQSKYKLNDKSSSDDSDSLDRCRYIYIYQFDLTGPTQSNSWGKTIQTGQLTGYVPIELYDVEIENDNVLDYKADVSFASDYFYFFPKSFKNLDEAKQKVLDAEKYDIVAL